MNCHTPGFLVLHHLPELAQTRVHWVSNAIQPSCPLSSPSPPTFNLSQHQGLFKWVSSPHQVAKILELQLQHQSFQWIFRVDFLWDWLVWSPCSPRDSQESSPTLQFKSINSSVSLSHQEASISLSSFSIRGQTDWKPQSQKTKSRATLDRWVMVERSDKTWSTGEENGKSLQYFCLESPMNSMKGQKDRTLKDELPRLIDAQYATGDQWRNNSRKNEETSQSKNNTQLWMWLVMEVKSNAVLHRNLGC